MIRRARWARRAAGRAFAAAAALGAALLVAGTALAHPLGNFTINHFAAIRVSPDRIALDVVIDRAEIPAFQEQQRLDADGDGTLSAAELDGQAEAGCTALLADLRLTVGDSPVDPSLVAAGLSTPPGAGGLTTMRLVCEYTASLAAPIERPTTVAFEDRSFAERIGWREIVVLGDRVVIDGRSSSGASGGGTSERLTAYPDDLLTRPLDQRSASVEVAPGGSPLDPWVAPDARPLAVAPPIDGAAAPALPGAVPGGITEDLAAIVDIEDATPIAILLSLAVAFGLGIVHALSPGHGKTIMAAYLVGSGGSTRQAVGLGLAVAISHTLGVLVLAAITLGASALLPPERLYPILGVVSGALVIAIGASLLWSRLREVAHGGAHAHVHEQGHAHGHEHGHEHAHAHPHPHPHPHGARAHDVHPHPHAHAHDAHADALPKATFSWRGMVALGLSGGLVPSASALLLLLGSIAAGRVAYGLVLVLGFGLGMAAVLTAIGLLLVRARRLVERRPSLGFGRLAAPIQLGAASLVVVLGVVLTGQALTQVL